MNNKFEISVCYKKVFELLNKVSGVQELINKIAEFTETVIVVTDIAGKIIAVSDEATKQKEELFEQLVMDLYKKQEKCSAVQSFCVDEYCMGFSVGNYSIKGNEEGFVFIFDENEDEAHQLNDIVRQAVGIVTERFGRQIHCHASTQRRRIAKALFENQDTLRKQIKEITLKGPFVAAFFQLEAKEIPSLQKLENEIIDSWENSFVYISNNQMYVLFEDIYGEEKETALHNKIEIFCEKNELYCAIGERFENIELLQQKKFLLKETLLAASREKRINREYDFYLEMICACAADKIGHARYMEEKLQKMWEDDRIKGTEFYRSLKEYLLLRNNVSMTAKKLFIHRNTMIYRLSRVTEFLGVDINDPATANNLLISMILQEIERRNS